MEAIIWIIWLAVVVLMIASYWMIFEKAGKPGFLAIIPIVNIIILWQISGRPGWWAIGLLVPIVNILVVGAVMVGVAERFGKDVLWGIGLWFIPFIFAPMLAFGDAKYKKI